MAADLSTRFAAYPEPLRRLLALGSCGRNHLLECAALGFSLEGGPDTEQACARMLLSAWGESPLSGDLAGVVLDTPHMQGLLDQPTRDLLGRVHRSWKRPANLEYFLRLTGQRRFDKLRPYLETQVAREPDNLFWYEQALILGVFEGDHGFALDLLARCPLEDIAPCLDAARCQTLLLARDHEAALPLLDGLCEGPARFFGAGFAESLRARALDLAGRPGEAMEQRFLALDQAPWRTSQALTLSEHFRQPHTAALDGSLAILLYSWNKADDLDAALAAIFASDLNQATGGAMVFVMDNGSTDHTPAVLDAWGERAGAALRRIDLPVNVGAPAARNWLMSLPEVREYDFCLYLDDDALVPEDWLARLGAAVKRYPEAGVWGCKVYDAAQPALIQAADYHFHPQAGAEADTSLAEPDLTRLEPNPVRLSNLHVQTMDLGQFDYCRPCASVTGCCHLYRTETLLGLGGFSLNLSPSQYDDMEHDLRLNARGGYAVYQGGLAVAHRKRTGSVGLTSPRENSAAVGNRYKLQVMHPAEEIAASRQRDLERILADLESRYRLLDQFRESAGTAEGDDAP